jgi:hypothetical protein
MDYLATEKMTLYFKFETSRKYEYLLNISAGERAKFTSDFIGVCTRSDDVRVALHQRTIVYFYNFF